MSAAGFAPSTLGMYEAHGTGTTVGDRAELETITTVMRADRLRQRRAPWVP